MLWWTTLAIFQPFNLQDQTKAENNEYNFLRKHINLSSPRNSLLAKDVVFPTVEVKFFAKT